MTCTKSKTSKTKFRELHFSIEGKWFTWILRHLWIEGNHVKAMRIWEGAFPKISKPEHYKTVFLEIVSGKKKFVGMNTFTMEDDGRKHWSSDRFSDEDEGMPLIDSWEDVILLKKTKLYIHELELRSFRESRRFAEDRTGSTGKRSNMYAMNWINACDENIQENRIRRAVNELYTDVRNLSYKFGIDIILDELPTGNAPLQEGPSAKKQGPEWARSSAEKKEDGLRESKFEDRFNFKNVIMSKLRPIKEYFRVKYGDELYIFDDHAVDIICDIPEDDPANWPMKDMAEERTEIPKSIIDAEIAKVTKMVNYAKIEEKLGIPTNPLGITLDDYIGKAIKDSKRTGIESENPKETEWASGYIDLEGNFYGCPDIGHVAYADELCEHFKIELTGKTCTFHKDSKGVPDAQKTLDKLGWIKISCSRFYWDKYVGKDMRERKITQSQKDAIWDYMQGKGMKTAEFETQFGKRITFEEAFKNDM